MKKLCLAIFVFALAGCASKPNETYMGYDVVSMPFNIAGGDVIYLPVTDAGAIPAENNGYKMQVAGFTIGESKVHDNEAEIIWNFAFSSMSDQEISNIVIEELAPTKVIKVLAEVENPQLIDGRWSLNLEPSKASAINTPWIFSDKASVYVFRIIINLESGEQVILNQPAWFSKPVLNGFASQIISIENG
ncbi:hypothetical protein VST7929_02969 [Vibrio stylophorae]|uniref:Lipoprotein n=1 Tax=Vibrio stylophorae TaxID=659351 RepID=A0ABM8ZXE7_9VIBR|nr:hypothetical protein [Vibrio stylophorae]CAH0535396.1 hypothetical protein VST7929_02969 [Vibrio stylophorae]